VKTFLLRHRFSSQFEASSQFRWQRLYVRCW